MTDSQKIRKRTGTGNALIRFSGGVLLLSALVKSAQFAKPVAYMNFLGYDTGKMLLIAAMEIGIALLFLRRTTRAVGLLLLSAYFGGAISAHLASHPLNSSAPIVIFNFHHPYLGALPAVIVLASAWIGVYLRHPEALWSAGEKAPHLLHDTGRAAMHPAA